MEGAKRVGRYFEAVMAANTKEAVIVLAMILASAAFAAGCAGGSQEQADPGDAGSDGAPTSEPTAEDTTASGQGDGAEARAGDALVVQAGDAEVRVGVDGVVVRAGDSEVQVGGGVVAGEGGEDTTEGSAEEAGGAPQEVTLEILGTVGTEFSGTCAIGDEEHDLSGRIPESFSYELNGRGIECEIRKQGAEAGSLRAVLTGNGIRSVQQTDVPNGTIRLSYSGDGVSSSTSSSSGSR